MSKYLIVYKRSVYHEGDERSRTNPGHGYPAYTSYEEFNKWCDTEEEVRKWIGYNEKVGHYEFKLYSVSELTVSRKTVIEF